MNRRNFLKTSGAIPLSVVVPGISSDDIKVSTTINETGEFVDIVLKAHYKDRFLGVKTHVSRVHLLNGTKEIEAQSSMLQELVTAFKDSVDAGVTQEHINGMFNHVTEVINIANKNEDWKEDFGYTHDTWRKALAGDKEAKSVVQSEEMDWGDYARYIKYEVGAEGTNEDFKRLRKNYREWKAANGGTV